MGLALTCFVQNANSQQIVWGAGSSNTTIDSIGRFAFPFETVNGWSNQSVSNGNGPTSTPMWTRSMSAMSQGGYFSGLPAMTSPSMSDGVALFDSDFLDNGGTAGAFGTGIAPSPQYGRLLSPNFDMSAFSGSNFNIELYLYYRNFDIVDLSVGFSNDGGVSWHDLSIDQGVAVNTVFPTSLISVSIPSAFTSSVSLTNCKLRLNFDGDYYYAMIDDIRIVTACPTITNSIMVTECENYISPAGNLHTVSEVFTDTISSVSGCDSLITVDLTINNPSSNTITVSECDSYISPSGNLHTTSEVFTDTLTNLAGCDSLITVDLTIVNLNTSVTVNQFQLTADLSGVNYQWIDCSTNTAIAGATSQTFTPTTDGDYAVVLSNGSCSDSSTCNTIEGLGIGSLSLKKNVDIYPNPTNGLIEINSDVLIGNVIIYSQLGTKVYEYEMSDFSKTLNIDFLENGFYYIEFETDKSIEKQTFILKK